MDAKIIGRILGIALRVFLFVVGCVCQDGEIVSSIQCSSGNTRLFLVIEDREEANLTAGGSRHRWALRPPSQCDTSRPDHSSKSCLHMCCINYVACSYVGARCSIDCELGEVIACHEFAIKACTGGSRTDPRILPPDDRIA